MTEIEEDHDEFVALLVLQGTKNLNFYLLGTPQKENHEKTNLGVQAKLTSIR